jgi:hypothetical protein
LKAHFSQAARDGNPFAAFESFDSVRASCCFAVFFVSQQDARFAFATHSRTLSLLPLALTKND